MAEECVDSIQQLSLLKISLLNRNLNWTYYLAVFSTTKILLDFFKVK